MSFDNAIEKVKQTLRRAAERLSGETAPVSAGMPSVESLANRPLQGPRSDILESDREILIRMDVPGADPKSTVVYLDDNGLLTAHIGIQAEDESYRSLISEFALADWYQTFQLPFHISGGDISASVKNGVLTIRVPKREKTKKVIVPVNSDG
ncbi:MAG: Hsp20/alpha crystallin family protein [Myxococcota bacterium]|nr:Hsp20/alpha crystallin family protein [Myxococcota bacterium]